jgi:hypothetical protein
MLSKYFFKIITITIGIALFLNLLIIPVLAKKKDKITDVPLPSPQYYFIPCNTLKGEQELDFFGINKLRQVNTQGVISPDKTKMAYTEVYYYPQAKQTSSRLFLITLDTSKFDTDRVLTASIDNKNPSPLIESGMDIKNYIFSTLTVIDWSADSSKLLVKEKTGKNKGGIWGTNIWVYDFTQNKAINLDAIRKAIVYYWKNERGIFLEDFRWDVVPAGWDAYNPDRVIVYAYGYNYNAKKFLGTWSIDCNNERSVLLSPDSKDFDISNNGWVLKKTK